MVEHFEEVNNLMQRLYGKEGYRHDSQTIRELFDIHNKVFPQTLEYSVSCSGCRERVYNRLRNFWIDAGGKLNG